MYDPDESKKLVKHFSNRSRKPAKIGSGRSARFLVPRTLDDQGSPLCPEKIGTQKYVWDFNLKEARFLKAYQDSNLNLEEACGKSGVEPQWAKKFLQNKSAVEFLAEDNHNAALAEIASARWVKGELASVAIGEKDPTDNQKWAIDKLKDIVIPKASAHVSIQQNVYQMPQLPPEKAEEARAFFDKLADIHEAQVVDRPAA